MTDPTSLAAFRFGYGYPLPAGTPTEPAAMLKLLAGPDLAAKTWPGIGLGEALPLYRTSAAARREARLGEEQKLRYKAAVRAIRMQTQDATQVMLTRAVLSPDGFRERLVQFWADHFTTKGRFLQDASLPSALVEDAVRPHVAGRFGDMLKLAVLHPAMLMYLDQVLSYGPESPEGIKRKRGLNENLARELIELHTLGVGADYSQDDVRQMAELLTGVVFDPEVGQAFDPDRAEPGDETVLGRVYSGEGMKPVLAALDDLALRPETAAHIARKLAVHFVSDTPDAGLVAAMTQAYTASGGDLMAVYGALLGHPAAWGPLAKVRQPFDFMSASLRALGLDDVRLIKMGNGKFRRNILLPMGGMGQPWQEPGGPDGWPEVAEAWITPQGLAGRIAWAMAVPEQLVNPLPAPRDFAVTALGPLASERLLWAAERAEKISDGIGLVLASPEFNRR